LTKIGDSGKKNVVFINPGNSLAYTLEEDRFLAYCLFKYGYGQWELIRNEFRNSPLFLFNWAVKCRSLQDIQRRCDSLIASFKKEILHYQ